MLSEPIGIPKLLLGLGDGEVQDVRYGPVSECCMVWLILDTYIGINILQLYQGLGQHMSTTYRRYLAM